MSSPEAKIFIGIAERLAAQISIRNVKGSAKPVPASLAAVTDGKKYQSSPAEWKGEDPTMGFTCVRFVMDSPQWWQYEVVTDSPGSAVGNKFVAYARRQVGKEIIEFSLTGVLGAGGMLSISPSIAETKKPAP